jgi:glycosyltransferase involved in cell wall biosynthesis
MLSNPYHRGGVERWMVEFALAWSHSGRECWFVTPHPRAPFRSAGANSTVESLLRRADPSSSALHINGPAVGPEFEFGTEAYRAMVYERAVIDSIPPAVPILPSDDTAAWRACERLADRNPIVLVSHGDSDSLYTRLGDLGSRAAAIVAISNRIHRRISRLPLPARCIVADIPLGISLGESVNHTERPPSEPLRLVWVGRMDEESKRVSDLPKIASELSSRGMRFTLDLVGDGPFRRTLEEMVEQCVARERIRFLGWQHAPDVRRVLSDSDVLLLPSNREGMPMTVIEALAHGCAVVASRVSGVEDFDGHALSRDCFWVHDVGDVRAAADSVMAAAAVSRVTQRRAARTLAEAEFSIGRCVERYAGLIQTLPNDRQPPTSASPLRNRVISLASRPVAAQRRLRLWVSGQ